MNEMRSRRRINFRVGLAIGLILAWSGGTPALRAELTWQTTTVELYPTPGTAVVEAHFPFMNDGKEPVDIRDVQTSCGCTTATLVQRHYVPGLGGEIVARYTLGQRVGLQTKTVAVATSDSTEPVTLTLVVHPVEWLRAQPTFVTWKATDPTTPKTIALAPVQTAPPVEDLSVQSSDPDVAAELVADPESGKYQMRIIPKETDHAHFSTLTVRFHVRGQQKTLRCFAIVQAGR